MRNERKTNREIIQFGFDDLIEAYIDKIDATKVGESLDDYDQLCEELRDSIDLEDFLRVVGAWNHKAHEIGVAMYVLQEICQEKNYNSPSL
jgi:hypothetical protein